MNRIVSHYRILEKLGAGGMGVVYKAEDTKLKRTVALKFLPPELTKDAQAEARFLQEARAAAALDHPNICTIHEINESEGQTYIAMAYVEGLSLKEKIAAGPLSVEEALDISGQVAEGLREAHERGIIHRDIKPANIMLTEKGQAKIMDFGLAKQTAVADVTKTLTVMGTVAYMSPEQAKGETVDHRTDIWSFGATIYEMLTGQMPFGRKHEQALIYSILNDAPEPLSRLRKAIPRPVEQLVLKALEKDKIRRYQTMAELLKDLKAARVSGLGASKPDKSIIVLPFENISADPEQEYFCDGMTEEIITDLSHVHDLLVISRSSAMTFKGTKKTIPEIARAVNVRYVLEGSVRKAGNNLRITAQLIDATNDAHLWADKYSGTLADVFEIQEKVSRSIVDALKLKLTLEERQEIIARPIENVAAYDLHIRARHKMSRETEMGLEQALQLVKKGLEIIGENEILRADEGQIYCLFMDMGIKKEENLLVKAEECIQKVFALNPRSSFGHFLRGMIRRKNGETQEAVREFRLSLTIDPNNPDSIAWLSWVYAHSGKVFAARPLISRLLEIDPLNPMNYFWAGAVEMMDGKFEFAIEEFNKGHQMDKGNPVIRYSIAIGLAYARRYEEAFKLFDQIEQEFSKTIWATLGSFIKFALQNKKSEALQTVTEELKILLIGEEMYTIWMAENYALINEENEAIDWLENGVKSGFINYPFIMEYDPFLANIRGEPRFQKLMERVKYEWEHFEV